MSFNIHPEHLTNRAINAVLKRAEKGHLPLFTWSLGLGYGDWVKMRAVCITGYLRFLTITPQSFVVIKNMTPQLFFELSRSIFKHRSSSVDVEKANWLARTLAAGCFGERHLWQDLGLSGRQDVSLLIATNFPELFNKNTSDMKWKQFLLTELLGKDKCLEMLFPACQGCDEFTTCFQEADFRDSSTSRSAYLVAQPA